MSLSPGISPKQLIPGMGVNDPLYNRQILPELNSLYQGICQSYPGGVVVVYAGAPIATRIFFLPFVYSEILFFPSIFCTIAVFSMYGEYIVVRCFLPDGVFLLCDHGLDFWHQLV